MGVRQQQLLEMLDLSRTKLWRMINNGEFPEPDRTNPRKLIWDLLEIKLWDSKLPVSMSKDS
jgi:predicted DNA-binding transcriptional regulator AlpA